MADVESKVVQVTNVSPTVTKEQMLHFFEYVGRVKDLKLYPEMDDPMTAPVPTKVCYVRYETSESAKVALHLGNTVFVDRALIVVPFHDANLPDEMKAMRVAAPASAVAGILPPTLQWPSQVVNMICGTGQQQTIQTVDAKLVEHGLPLYPPLPGNTEPSKIEEIRRTVYASNLDSIVTIDQLMQFFSQAGEVKYIRMAGDEQMPSRNAYIEFTSQKSVPMALGYNGVMLNGRPLKVTHSLSVIANKPQTKNEEALAKEIDEAMKKVKESQHVMAAAAEGTDGKRRSRSTSKSRKRRSRSRSKDRRYSRDERRRSSQPDKNVEKASKVSRDRHRRSRSHERSRDRSRDKKRRSRTPPRGHRSIRKSPTRRSPARRSPARRSPARRSPARRSPARRSPARKSPTRRSPSRRSPIRKSPARKSRSPSREKPRRRSKSKDRKEGSSKVRGSSVPKRSVTPVKSQDDSMVKLHDDSSPEGSQHKTSAADVDALRNGDTAASADNSWENNEGKTEIVTDSGITESATIDSDQALAKDAAAAGGGDHKPADDGDAKPKSPAKKERSLIDIKLEKHADYTSTKKKRSRSPVRKADDRSSRRSTSRSRTRRSTSRPKSKRSRSRSRARRSSSKSKSKQSSKSRTRRSSSRSRRKRSVSKTRSSKKSRSRSRQRRERSRSKEKRRHSRSVSTEKRSKKKKDRSRSRERDRSPRDRVSRSDRHQRRGSSDRRTPKEVKLSSKEKESSEEKKEVKVKRDYDEEEKGYDSGNEKTENSETKLSFDDAMAKAEPSEDARSDDSKSDDAKSDGGKSEVAKSEDMATDDKSEDMVMDDKSDDVRNADDSRSSFVSSNAAAEDSQH